MSYEVSVKEVPPQKVAAIRTHAAMTDIARETGSAFGELYGYLGRAGVAPAGMPTAVYFDVDAERGVDMEVCVPVGSDIVGEGRVMPDELRGGTVATTVHHGPYERLEFAYHAIQDWATAQGRQLAGPPREVYFNGPSDVAPEDLETEIDWPIR